MTCGKNGKIGLLGVDLYFSSIAEDVTYYSNYEDYTYGFILTTEGLLISHPSYPRPLTSNKQPIFVDVSYVEKVDNFNEVHEKMLREHEGSLILGSHNTTVRFNNIFVTFFSYLLIFQTKYVWKYVAEWYIICIVVRNKGELPLRPYNRYLIASPAIWLVHHRFDVMDVVPAQSLCRHLNQIATLSTYINTILSLLKIFLCFLCR